MAPKKHTNNAKKKKKTFASLLSEMFLIVLSSFKYGTLNSVGLRAGGMTQMVECLPNKLWSQLVEECNGTFL
jgi:divalent metal cation (Fe/Co/Zn/Cd) transporter